VPLSGRGQASCVSPAPFAAASERDHTQLRKWVILYSVQRYSVLRTRPTHAQRVANASFKGRHQWRVQRPTPLARPQCILSTRGGPCRGRGLLCGGEQRRLSPLICCVDASLVCTHARQAQSTHTSLPPIPKASCISSFPERAKGTLMRARPSGSRLGRTSQGRRRPFTITRFIYLLLTLQTSRCCLREIRVLSLTPLCTFTSSTLLSAAIYCFAQTSQATGASPLPVILSRRSTRDLASRFKSFVRRSGKPDNSLLGKLTLGIPSIRHALGGHGLGCRSAAHCVSAFDNATSAQQLHLDGCTSCPASFHPRHSA